LAQLGVDWLALSFVRRARDIAEARALVGPGIPLVAKIEKPDLLPILEACIAQLPDAFLRQVVWLKLHEECSERETARVLGVSVSRVHRRLQEAYALLRPMLEERGLDGGWLAA
jgi:DNA-directed RNA polymerase specialized sigma24 family protein